MLGAGCVLQDGCPGSSVADNMKVTSFCPGQTRGSLRPVGLFMHHWPCPGPGYLPAILSDCFTVMGHEGYSELCCQAKGPRRPDTIPTPPDAAGALESLILLSYC